MLPFISIGIAAGLFLGLLSFAAIGKLYFFVCGKRNRVSNDQKIEQYEDIAEKENNGAWLFCWPKASSAQYNTNLGSEVDEDVELGYGEMRMKSFVEDQSMEAELMRLHNLCGPPRFLFTIKEETLEDLVSDDGKTGTKLIDLMRDTDDNLLSPIASPMKKPSTSPLFSDGLVNPLHECLSEAQFNILLLSPPPKFKFLRDAEEKRQRKLEAERLQQQTKQSCSEVILVAAHEVHVQVIH